MNERDLADIFATLAHEARLQIVKLLRPAANKGLSAGEIAEALALSPSRLSFHLARLENAGVIQSRRISRRIIYSLNPEKLLYVIVGTTQCLHPDMSHATDNSPAAAAE